MYLERLKGSLDAYGVRSIEAHGEAGDEVRRVFYVDGFGREGSRRVNG